MKTFIFRIVAVVFGAAALYFYWTGNTDWAFAAFAVAVCGYFLGMRFQMKERIDARQRDDASEAEPPA
jgi:hypothetical protein